MTQQTIKILFIEDSPEDADAIKKLLSGEKRHQFSVEHVDTLKAGVERLYVGHFDIVLVDLSLPDSKGLATFENLQRNTADLPIILYSAPADEDIAIEAMKKGAQDYLVKGDTDVRVVVHAIRYAIERKHIEAKVKESKERYLDLLESANDMIQIADADDRLIYANLAWRETLGYDKNEIRGLSLHDVFHPINRSHCLDIFKRVKAGETFTHVSILFVSKEEKKIVTEGNINCKYFNGKPYEKLTLFK